jgi:protein-S-isoprenylcysteine O-methyltransferase Ste14
MGKGSTRVQTNVRRALDHERAGCGANRGQALRTLHGAVGGMMKRVVTAVVTLVGVSIYVGLAVLGWGGFEAFFANPARVALVVATFALALLSARFGVRYDTYRARTWRLIPGLY